MLSNTLKNLSTNSVITLDNITCVYCGNEISSETESKEHVIGRRFVPKGKLNGQWNLIVKACKKCNGIKSDLENDISAITMHADSWGGHVDEDKVLADEASRKAQKCISRHTGKLIKDSSESLKIKVPFVPGVDFSFGFTSPPQFSTDRAYELARLQLMAFFYLITYDKKKQRGGFWLGGYFPVDGSIQTDWGNPVQRSFMESVTEWEPRFLGIGAEGFFKVIIRRHPSSICWSWGLEWNKKYRIIGFLGEQEIAQKIVNTFLPIGAVTLAQGPNDYIKIKEDQALEEKDDLLFLWPEA